MELLAKIEELRQLMHSLALVHGIRHPAVMEVSQKLDELLNEYNKQFSC